MWRYGPQFEIGQRESSKDACLKILEPLDSSFLNASLSNFSRDRDSLFFFKKIAVVHVYAHRQ